MGGRLVTGGPKGLVLNLLDCLLVGHRLARPPQDTLPL